MKRIFATALALLVCVCLLSITANAAGASAGFTGPNTVRAGDTITVTFSVTGSGLKGLQGTIVYDSNLLTLTKTTQKISSPWVVEWNGSNFVAYDNNQENPINSNTALYALTFKVSSGASTGADLSVSCTNIKVSDGGGDVSVGTATYSKGIAAPLSNDNTLRSMSVSNATISPDFRSGTTSYTATVPYAVSKLNITAKANHSGAKVSISNPELAENATTNVTVTVTSESGRKKTYTIAVTREQDPNYVKSTDNSISAITVDGFLLSPVFTPEIKSYVIWLPYETEAVTVAGVNVDPKASVRVEGGGELIAGADNEIKVICTAEDGSENIYTVIAKRAAPHDGTAVEPAPTETTQPGTEPSAPAPVKPQDSNKITISKGAILLIALLVLVAGLGLGILFGRISRP